MEEAPCKRSRTNDDAGTGIMAGGGGDDRLSALPDCLLHEIMSRMKARQVVQTCVLSARWRHLWRSVPCFDADEGEFEFTVAEARAAPTFPDLLEMRWEKFEDFMDILLSPGNVSIAHLDKFRLGFTGCDSESKRGYRWIRRGIKYDGDAAQGPGIQRQGFSSTTRSWRLRKLHLDKMCLDALFSEHVGSGCPNLEDLELTECKLEFEAITSGSLKSLVLKKCCMIDGFREITSPMLSSLVIDGGSYTGDCLVVTTAPAAASVFLNVDVSGLFVGGFSLRGMTTSLAKASVRLRSRKIVDALKILGSVSDVMTNLELSQVMVLGECSATFPQLNNLRTLQLNRCDLSDGFQMLGLLLRNSPNLERLTLRWCKYSNDLKNKRRSSKSKPYPNLVDARCEKLKLTEIIYRGEDIHQLIELLLCISENLPNNYIKLIES
ncbi:F-box/LRR-repeat protein At3g58930 [Sorghum bicolor]|uniref:F-box domain-containing protein n=1 Tax=Sorghum bicolor TaxID=4558 RepID=A0A1B6PL12_SORBI|nr:F-box/LRR-repeat protein At3g58930 [Sorghum bicolor]KXG26362.1 hypothetical protein SORBI_3006G088500 [Sorghum bicolor]|eukprot:XP_021319351.1 F-box/LRR-repeat protein At3g58930 [Sorghum bicolor]